MINSLAIDIFISIMLSNHIQASHPNSQKRYKYNNLVGYCQIKFIFYGPYILAVSVLYIISNKNTTSMRISSSILGLLAIMMLIASAQDIVDFTYTQFDYRSVKSNRPSQNVQILPDRKTIEGYTFPEACSSAKKLEQLKIEDSNEVTSYDLDQKIQHLKTDFIDLLKVSQKIKRKKKNIEELAELSGRYTNVTVVPKSQLDDLKHTELKLEELNQKINDKSFELETLVKNSIKMTGGNQFAILSLNFEIQSNKLKLKYLRELKQRANDADAAKIKDQYDAYFKELKIKFENEDILINDAKGLLVGFGNLESLRAQILNLKTKINLNQLIIIEKQQCVKEKDQIKRLQKYDQDIKKHMSHLREKKKSGSINNKYCEGVVQKLESRVKSVLLSYDYTFLCAEGLDEIKVQTDKMKDQLRKLEAQVKKIQETKNIDELKDKFDEYRKIITVKQDQLNKFSIPKYYHDAGELNKLIKKTEEDLQECRKSKEKLGAPVGSKQVEVDYGKIQRYVSDIKRMKGIYCQEYQKYDNKAQKIWKVIHKFEGEVDYNLKMQGVYQQEINQLRTLEANFESIRQKILSRLK